MPLIARLGDLGSHGGEVCTSAARTYAEDILIARIGDNYCCLIHGTNKIITGCTRTFVEGKLVAFHGSATECGATISASAKRTYVE